LIFRPHPKEALEYLNYILLGIVQGITEFFPVSSDGHLVLAEYFLGFHQSSLLFDVLLHFGTLGSLCVVYRREVLELLVKSWALLVLALREGPKSALLRGDRWTVSILLTTFVTGMVGIAGESVVERLASSTLAAGVGFLMTAVFLFAANWKGKSSSLSLSSMSLWFSIWIGLAQGLALLPGVSRSGSTICLALILGLRREEAGRYSFVAAIPIIFLATVYELRKSFAQTSENWIAMSFGVLASFMVGFLAIRLLLLMLTRLALWPFAVYTLLAAGVSFLAAAGLL
jgi:undecaprenyl-diphosphatase